jgi:hypothetical protein
MGPDQSTNPANEGPTEEQVSQHNWHGVVMPRRFAISVGRKWMPRHAITTNKINQVSFVTGGGVIAVPPHLPLDAMANHAKGGVSKATFRPHPSECKEMPGQDQFIS